MRTVELFRNESTTAGPKLWNSLAVHRRQTGDIEQLKLKAAAKDIFVRVLSVDITAHCDYASNKR